MSALALPVMPSNLHVGTNMHLVDSDVYHICDRVKELSPRLNIYALDPPQRLGDTLYHYAVTECCEDGAERFVKRFEALDGRVIERLEYMLRVPFEHRVAEAEKQEEADELARKAAEHMELYERIGAPMLPDLERCGFIQRPKSYAKRGVTGGRGSKRA